LEAGKMYSVQVDRSQVDRHAIRISSIPGEYADARRNPGASHVYKHVRY
jgi:hypothetical protein